MSEFLLFGRLGDRHLRMDEAPKLSTTMRVKSSLVLQCGNDQFNDDVYISCSLSQLTCAKS